MNSEHPSGGYGYPVELYHEFLNLMERTDYSDNQIVLDGTSSSIKKTPTFRNSYIIPSKSTKPNDLQHRDLHLGFANSYPPTNYSSYLLRPETAPENAPDPTNSKTPNIDLHYQISPTSSSDSSNSNEFINMHDFNIPLDLTQQYDLTLDDNLSILSYEDDEDEENYRLQQQFLNTTDDTTNDSSDEAINPLVPGLFPKMDINDEDNFLKFDKLPLNPSYIVNSNDSR